MKYKDLIEKEITITQDLFDLLNQYENFRSTDPANVNFARGQEGAVVMMLDEIRYILKKHGYKVSK